MTATRESNCTRTLLLTPLESRTLLDILNQAVQWPESASDLSVLLSARDKLDDADGIAMWLRENVAFELTSREALMIAKSLQGQIRIEEERPGMPSSTLSEVGKKFSLMPSGHTCS